MITDLIIIGMIIAFITNISGVVDSIKYGLFRLVYRNVPYKHFSFKPLDCSLCQTFWIGLAYIWFTGNFTVGCVLGVSIIAMLSGHLTQLLHLIMVVFSRILEILSNIVEQEVYVEDETQDQKDTDNHKTE